MATLYSSSNPLSSYVIDASFDVDEALTFPVNLGRQIAESNSLVAYMPTAAGDVCAVCMESFPAGREVGKQVPCGHVYHPDCISSWLSHRNSCPLCRRLVSGDLQ